MTVHLRVITFPTKLLHGFLLSCLSVALIHGFKDV